MNGLSAIIAWVEEGTATAKHKAADEGERLKLTDCCRQLVGTLQTFAAIMA